ncbi:MAG: heterodisulfide reductase subunit A, partial [Alphaproteobacteria bacterium]|nr:heterodisulfide reductase subunit A [Alphaproteobacteria bacterium]
DLVVLATGMKPAASEGYVPDIAMEQDEYGFLVPSVEGDGGIIPAGVASGPLDVSMSVQSATAAALKAIQAVGPKS